MSDPAALRSEFPVLERLSYLNAGTNGPIPRRATDAARDAVQEILRRGADTGIFFAGAKSRGFSSELTAQDKEFLRAVSIKPER